MRKLASVRTVKDISSIPDADFIELAQIDGWQVVTKKDEIKKGDKVIYFEIDSFLPIREEFEFLRSSSYKRIGEAEGFKLKTIKLRGQISQGLVLPFSSLGLDGEDYSEHDDLTELLGVRLYEEVWAANLDAQQAFDFKGLFPSFIPKTDQERIQNNPEYLDLYKYIRFEVTIKLDGTSATFYDFEGSQGVCNKNYTLQEYSDCVYNRVNKKYSITEKIRGLNIAIQGEIMGPKVQGNKEKLDDLNFYVFNVYDISKQEYYSPVRARELTVQLGLEYVPVLFTDLELSHFDSQSIITLADGKSLKNDIREGIVFKANTPPFVSFKVISNKFLLKYDR